MNRTHIGLGIFVVGTLALLVWLAQSLGALGGGRGDRYELRLEHAAGLVQSNAVKIAGVSIGRIERVSVDHDVAVLTLLVDRDVVLHSDARAIVRAKSLLGEKYLQIEPGTRESPVLEPGGTIENVARPFEIDEVLNALEPILGGDESIAAALAPLATTLAELLDDAAGKKGKPPIMTRDDITQIVDDVKATSASVRRMTEENEETVKALLENTNALMADPRLGRVLTRADSISKTVDDKLPGLMERTESALARTEQALGKLEKLAEVVDEPRRKKIGTIIDDTAVATANLRRLSTDLAQLSKTLEPLMKNLSVIARRASTIDEEVIRQFLQREGMKIFVGGRRDAQRALE
jgi:phospholipid/cholesterol/gamma-HCH transport system substrate-binding protein